MRDPQRRAFFALFCALAAFSAVGAFPGGEIGERDLRLRRYIINDHEVTVNVEWLTDEQLSELGTLDSPAQVTKIRHFYEQLVSAEERRAAANKIVTQCHDWLLEVTTEAERVELKRLHRANHTACAERIAEYIGRLAAHRQTHLRRYWSFCEHVANDTAAEAEELQEEEQELLDEGHTDRPEDQKGNESTAGTTPMVALAGTNEKVAPRQTRAIIYPTRVRRAALPSHAHHHHTSENHEPFADLEDCFKSHLDWLTDEQKDRLRQSRNVDKSQIQHIIFGFYDRTTGETREHATEALKDYCSHLFRDIFGAANAAVVENLRADGASSVDVSAAVQRYYQGIEDENQKAKARERLPECTKLFGLVKEVVRKRRDVVSALDIHDQDLYQDKAVRYRRELAGHNHSDPNHIHDHKKHHILEDYFKTHLAWLTDAQKVELKSLKESGKSRDDLQAKIQEFYDATTGETRQKATELLKAGCVELFKSLFGDEKFAEVKKLKESGTPIAQIVAKIEGFKSTLEADKKAKADQYGPHCQRLYAGSEPARFKRTAIHAMAETVRHGSHRHGHPDYPMGHADWLSSAQLEELRAARAAGSDPLEIQARLFDMYWEIPTKSRRIRANFHIKRDCLGYFTSVVSELTENLDALDRRQNELDPRDVLYVLNRMIDAYQTHRKSHIWAMYRDYCSRIFPKPDFENDHQPIETINAEVLILDAFRQAFDHYVPRDPSAHDWLNESQREELESRPEPRTDDERLELLSRLLNWQRKLSDIRSVPTSDSARATESAIQMKRACVNNAVWFTIDLKNTLNAIVSQSNMSIETLNDAPAAMTVIHDIDRVFNVMRAAHANQLLKDSTALCRPLLHDTASNRQRRHVDAAPGQESASHVAHHGNHSLDDYFKTHLAWLTDAQKDELRALKTDGKSRADLQAKVLQYYEATTGESRQKATELLKAGCVELFKAIFGTEKFEEVKKLKESGTPFDDIVKKVTEFGASLTNDHQKAQLKEYGPQCRSFFTADVPPVVTARRRREIAADEKHVHAHEHHSLQDYFNSHLIWLTDAQKEELSTLKASGAERSALYAKMAEYFEGTTGETRRKAVELLRGACREFFIGTFGEEKLAEIKKLNADGKSKDEIAATVEGFAAALTDEEKKTKAKLYIPYCKKLFTLELKTEAQSRRRRAAEAETEAAAAAQAAKTHDHDRNHNLKDYYSTHLTWLEEAQKAELDQLKADGKDVKALTAKIQEYYASATGERKDRATELLKAGCVELFTNVFGAEKLAEVKRLKESGTSIDEISAQIAKFQAELVDPTKKARAEEYGPYCKRLFTQSTAHRSQLDYFETHLSWLTDEQKNLMQDCESTGCTDYELQAMVERFYGQLAAGSPVRTRAGRLLRSACAEWYTSVFGEAAVARLARGGSESAESVNVLVNQLPSEETRQKASHYVSFCRRIGAAVGSPPLSSEDPTDNFCMRHGSYH